MRHCTVFWLKWPVHDLVLVTPPPPLFKVASNTRPCSKLGGTTLNGGRRGVTILSHRPVTRSDLKQDRLFFCESVSTFLQLVVELVWKGVYKPMSLSFLACEQAPLFGRAKRAFSRGRVYFSRYPQMENLLVASYRFWMLFRLIYRRGGDS